MDAPDLPERSVEIRLSYHVGIAQLDAVLAITNRARRPVQFEVAWILARTSRTHLSSRRVKRLGEPAWLVVTN